MIKEELNKILDSANSAQLCFSSGNEREALYYINGIQSRVKRLLENASITPRTERNTSNIQHALGEAVSAIYFADRSDYKTALWQIVRDLGGEEAVNLLESDESAAYHKYAADRNF